MPLLGGISSFLDKYILGYALGTAAGPALRPFVQDLANEAWTLNQVLPPQAYVLAVGVAEGKVDEGDARSWSHEQGISDAAFSALVGIAKAGPGVSEAFRLWRRGEINEAGFRRALERQGLADEWIDAFWKIRESVLDPADIARGIHRGLIPDPGLLQGELPSGVGNVPAYPVYPVDALKEAQAAGIDRDRLGVLVGLQGNPMGPHEAAEAEFRGVLDHNDFLRAIAEGNTRNEWAEAIFEQSRQIPTARDFLENALRGYRTLAQALAGAARHGMSAADATMIYQNQGRPMVVRQITQALARGGKFKPEPGEITDPYDASIVEGNLKPAYYDMAKALRYTYPSAFVLRSLIQAGDITQAKGEQVLLYEGWEPGFAKLVTEAWAGGAAAAGKAETKAELLAEYEGGYISQSELRDHLTALGYTGAVLDREVALGDARRIRSWRGKAETAINKAFLKGSIEADTAQADLAELGLDPDYIARVLAIWQLEARL